MLIVWSSAYMVIQDKGVGTVVALWAEAPHSPRFWGSIIIIITHYNYYVGINGKGCLNFDQILVEINLKRKIIIETVAWPKKKSA